MKIEKWPGPGEQTCSTGGHKFSVARLIELSKSLPVMEIPLDHLNVYYTYKNMSLRMFVSHMQAVLDADMSCPIILDEDGEILDGRHRVMKAMLHGDKTIKAVRFDENPTPDWIEP